METLEDELEEKKVFCISPKGAELYVSPGHWFTETSISFPSAMGDIEEACKCFALERYTACVYHSMGILQIGLFALARDVGITLKFPIEFAEWGDITELAGCHCGNWRTKAPTPRTLQPEAAQGCASPSCYRLDLLFQILSDFKVCHQFEVESHVLDFPLINLWAILAEVFAESFDLLDAPLLREANVQFHSRIVARMWFWGQWISSAFSVLMS
jgi:hypothetical protein